MRLTISAALLSATSAQRQGFVTDTCNIDNIGQGCDGTQRCAYVGLGFIDEAVEENNNRREDARDQSRDEIRGQTGDNTTEADNLRALYQKYIRNENLRQQEEEDRYVTLA